MELQSEGIAWEEKEVLEVVYEQNLVEGERECRTSPLDFVLEEDEAIERE